MVERWWIASAWLLVACGGVPSEGVVVEAASGAEREAGPTLSELLGAPGESLSPDRLDTIASLIRELEQDPHATFPENDTGKPVPAALRAWLDGSPDVQVSVCGFLKELAETEGGTGRVPLDAIDDGYAFGMAAKMIDEPGTDPDSAPVQVAGAESALRWYAAARRRGAVESELMERLRAAAERDGGLHGWYAERGIQCGDPDAPAEPNYRRAMLQDR